MQRKKFFRRVLVVHPYGIGDALFLTPVLRALWLVEGMECVDLLLGSRTDSIFSNNPHVTQIMVWERDRFQAQSLKEKLRIGYQFCQKLAQRRYDLLLDYSLRDEYGFLAKFFWRIPARAGFGYKGRGRFHNLRYQLECGFTKHVVDCYAEMAQRAGIPVEDRWLEFYLTDAELLQAQQMATKWFGGRPYFCLAPGGGASWGKDAFLKQWPPYFFVELMKKIYQQGIKLPCLLVGTKQETPLCETIANAFRQNAIEFQNMAGKLALRICAAFIKHAICFLGNDSGLVHVASALKVPLVAFYGPVAPEIYGPYNAQHAFVLFREDLDCRPCYKAFRYNDQCVHQECLKAFSPEKAFALLEAKQFIPFLKTRLGLTIGRGGL